VQDLVWNQAIGGLGRRSRAVEPPSEEEVRPSGTDSPLKKRSTGWRYAPLEMSPLWERGGGGRNQTLGSLGRRGSALEPPSECQVRPRA